MTTNLPQARDILERHCAEHNVVLETVPAPGECQAFFIPGPNRSIAQKVKEEAAGLPVHVKTAHIDAGDIVLFSATPIAEEVATDIAEDACSCYNSLWTKLSGVLDKPLSEIQFKAPSTALRRANASNQFPGGLQDPTKEDEKGRKKKAISPITVDDKISEALDGIATATGIQPQEGLKSLFSAMKGSGLDRALKKLGVSWHVAEPGKHMVTWVRDKIPILQKTTVELADEKELAETLSQLASIAQGKAPDAAQLELDRVKEMASRANERQKALDQVAGQFAIPDPEDQQQVNVAPIQPGVR